MAISDKYLALYASDTINPTPALALTVSGRFNFAEVDLQDQGGGDLSGNHAFSRFNPAIGATYKVAPCASSQNSCSLANFFVEDPDLRQVVAHTVEAGVRGRISLAYDSRLNYDLSLFHTNSDDDIIFVNSVTLNRAFFANVGQTRRQGISARTDYKISRATAYLAYTYTEATFQTGYVEAGGSNPAKNADGNIMIKPGDELPGVPRSTLKGGLDLDVTIACHIGADGVLQSGQYLFGDEANLTPRLPGFSS